MTNSRRILVRHRYLWRFYLNATKAPFSTNYKMYDYVVTELPKLMAENFPW